MTNKEVVSLFYKKVFNEYDFSVIDDLMRDDYRQHSPEVADGKAGFMEFIKGFTAMHPKTEISHMIEEGDLVCVFFKCNMDHGVIAKVFDLYRIQDGKLAEHWDCTMRVDGMESKNSNGQF